MSMVSSQADELRTLANELDERERHMDAYVQAMREAADTIDALRKQIAKCQIAELKADYDTSRYFELFGTPERAARTLQEFDPSTRCLDCLFGNICGDEVGCIYELNNDALLGWLRGDAE